MRSDPKKDYAGAARTSSSPDEDGVRPGSVRLVFHDPFSSLDSSVDEEKGRPAYEPPGPAGGRKRSDRRPDPSRREQAKRMVVRDLARLGSVHQVCTAPGDGPCRDTSFPPPDRTP